VLSGRTMRFLARRERTIATRCSRRARDHLSRSAPTRRWIATAVPLRSCPSRRALSEGEHVFRSKLPSLLAFPELRNAASSNPFSCVYAFFCLFPLQTALAPAYRWATSPGRRGSKPASMLAAPHLLPRLA